MRIPSTILAVAAMAACVSPTNPPQAEEPAPSEPFALRVGEEARTVEGLAVRFAAVIGDSRCPSDVTCIWAGDAEIEVVLSQGDGQQPLRLHTHGGDRYPRSARAFGHSLKLQALEPYPVSTREIAPEDYVATLLLTRSE